MHLKKRRLLFCVLLLAGALFPFLTSQRHDSQQGRQISKPTGHLPRTPLRSKGTQEASEGPAAPALPTSTPTEAPLRTYDIPLTVYEGIVKNEGGKVGQLSVVILGNWIHDTIDGELEITEYDDELVEKQKVRITRDRIEEFLEPLAQGARFYAIPSDDEGTLFRFMRTNREIVGAIYRAQDAEGLKYEANFKLHPVSRP